MAQAAGEVESRVTRAEAESLAERCSGAFYLLDLDRVSAAHDALLAPLRRRHPDTVLAYSVKTNYTPRVLQRMRALGSLAEVVSEMEYDIARRVGFTPEEIVVNGAVHHPGFLADVLLAGGRVHLDGQAMLEVLHEVSRAHPERTFPVGLRLSYPVPDADTSRFGFASDEASLDRLAAWFRAHPNCEPAGFHSHFCFAPNRLDAFRARTAGLVDAAARLGVRPRWIDIGSGFRQGGEPSFEEVAEAVTGVLADRFAPGERPRLPTLIIEPGTALVGHAMAFVCRVHDVKTVEGRTVAVVDGSSHCINTMGWRTRMAVEVLRADNGHGAVNPSADAGTTFDVVGHTAMERKDHLCDGVPGPVAPGDFLVFDAVGSYSTGMKPPFIHPCPAVVAREGGRHEVVKRRETVDDILRTYVL
jgi:diaminopimelate decarboxylase